MNRRSQGIVAGLFLSLLISGCSDQTRYKSIHLALLQKDKELNEVVRKVKDTKSYDEVAPVLDETKKQIDQYVQELKSFGTPTEENVMWWRQEILPATEKTIEEFRAICSTIKDPALKAKLTKLGERATQVTNDKPRTHTTTYLALLGIVLALGIVLLAVLYRKRPVASQSGPVSDVT